MKQKSGFVLLLLSFTIIAVLILMGTNSMAKTEASSPSGVLYFSNGADIVRYSFKGRKKKVLLSNPHSFFLFPNYSARRKKIFFLEDVLTEGSYISMIGLDPSSTHERIKKLSRRCVTLSLQMKNRSSVQTKA